MSIYIENYINQKCTMSKALSTTAFRGELTSYWKNRGVNTNLTAEKTCTTMPVFTNIHIFFQGEHVH